MILLVDIGNTRLKWAQSDRARLFGHGYATYSADRIHKDLIDCWEKLERPERIIVSNVAGPVIKQAVSEWVFEKWLRRAEFITAEQKACGVTSAYSDPATLGADRWASLIATHDKFKEPACIVDCGTATTIDVLTANGEHLGGLILPGVTLMRGSLTENTSDIGGATSGGTSLLTRTTEDAVAAGSLYATVGLVDKVMSHVKATQGTPVECVLTGGDAELVRPLLIQSCRYEPDLVLQGLAVRTKDDQ